MVCKVCRVVENRRKYDKKDVTIFDLIHPVLDLWMVSTRDHEICRRLSYLPRIVDLETLRSLVVAGLSSLRTGDAQVPLHH